MPGLDPPAVQKPAQRGEVPVIDAFLCTAAKTWMAGTSPAMTLGMQPLNSVEQQRSENLPRRQVPHQSPDPERPRLALVASAHAVDELAELGCGDRDNVVALVRETLPRRIAILHGCEHGAEEQRESIGILMHRADGLSHEVGRIAADVADRRVTFEYKTVRPGHGERDLHPADIVERECRVEQA